MRHFDLAFGVPLKVMVMRGDSCSSTQGRSWLGDTMLEVLVAMKQHETTMEFEREFVRSF